VKLAHRLPQLSAEAVYFVTLFSRFEFAAKRSGWLRQGRVLVDWKLVAEAFDDTFFDEIEVKEEAQYLLEEPPKQLVPGGQVGVVFDAAHLPRVKSTLDTFSAVATVRNNLAHGEKPFWDHRDQALVAFASFILEEAVAFSERAGMPFAAYLDYAPTGHQ